MQREKHFTSPVYLTSSFTMDIQERGWCPCPVQKTTQHPGSVASLQYPRGYNLCYISADTTVRWLFTFSHSCQGSEAQGA